MCVKAIPLFNKISIVYVTTFMLQRINIFYINAVHPVIYVRVSILHVKNTSNSISFHRGEVWTNKISLTLPLFSVKCLYQPRSERLGVIYMCVRGYRCASHLMQQPTLTYKYLHMGLKFIYKMSASCFYYKRFFL